MNIIWLKIERVYIENKDLDYQLLVKNNNAYCLTFEEVDINGSNKINSINFNTAEEALNYMLRYNENID